MPVGIGKEGVGKRKRSSSPRPVSYSAKDDHQIAKVDFRDRARRQYEERRDQQRLQNAIKSCRTFDEKAGITVECGLHT
jgi:hypothetical protein